MKETRAKLCICSIAAIEPGAAADILAAYPIRQEQTVSRPRAVIPADVQRQRAIGTLTAYVLDQTWRFGDRRADVLESIALALRERASELRAARLDADA